MRTKIVSIIIMTLLITTGSIAVADWDEGDDYKMHWPQLPDPNGWDVYSTAGLSQWPWVSCADDWQCSESGFITDVHFWGSWLGDIVGTINHFVICIAKNIPAEQNPNGDWSCPGETLVEWEIYDWIERGPYTGNQGWYWSYSEQWQPDDHQLYYQYNVFLDESQWIWQEQGEIYWLCISAIVNEEPPNQPLWGWKSTFEDPQFMDNAVWGLWYELYWLPMYFPNGMAMDLAFVITGFNPESCDPVVDVWKYVWDPFNEDWVAPSTPGEALELPICSTAEFKLVMNNVGNADLNDGAIDDLMLGAGLEYIDADPEPSSAEYVDPHWLLKWDNLDLLTDETNEIKIRAKVVGEHCSVYYQKEEYIIYCNCGYSLCDCPPQIGERYIYIHAKNFAPLKPSIDGPPTGNPNIEYKFKFKTDDPNPCDSIKYIIDWGDGNTEETDCVPSGTQLEVGHTYSTKKTYTIKAKAQECPDGLIGPEETFSIDINPRTRAYINIPFIEFLNNHPNIFLILRLLLRL